MYNKCHKLPTSGQINVGDQIMMVNAHALLTVGLKEAYKRLMDAFKSAEVNYHILIIQSQFSYSVSIFRR